MKAIKTKYNGYEFRSRLEARWAVFFTELNIAWEYELEGFENGQTRYLPDFYLPDYDLWIEIKPIGHGNKDLNKWIMLSSEKILLVLTGTPHAKPSEIYGLKPYTMLVIPFADLINPKYGYFWGCSGSENFGNIEPFKNAIEKSKQITF